MHVDIRLIQNNGRIGIRPRKKPNSLQPHLKPMAHESDFCDEVAISHHQSEFGTGLTVCAFKVANLYPRP